jgi:hypothetical protein
MTTRMQQRRGTSTQWTAANPVLAAGEIGFETDTNKFKIGDGTSTWSLLQYFINLDGLDIDVNGFVKDTKIGVALGVASLNANGQVPLSQLQELIDNAPGALDTLNEIATVITSVEGSLSTHNASTTNVHGIANTALLATTANVETAKTEAIAAAATDATTKAAAAKTDAQNFASGAIETAVTTHNSDTTDVHGIANTTLLATKSYVAGELSAAIANEVVGRNSAIEVSQNASSADATTKASAAQTYADGILSTHNLGTTNIHGIADTAALATKAYSDSALATHEADTTNVHGIADTTALATKTYVDTADALKAAVASPAFTGTPTAPTAAAGTATTQIATTAFVGTAVADLVASAPAALNTLNELATALGNDASFSTTITNALALKATKVELTEATLTAFNAKTTSYTLALSDSTNLVEMDSSSANTVTIPSDSTVAFPVGSAVDVFQRGTGQTTLVAGSGVTLLFTPGLKLRDRYSAATCIKRAANTWIVTGDLTV